jgi:hypothetical protein
MIFSVIGHVSEDQISFIRFRWRRFGSGLIVALCLKVLEVLGCEDIDVAGNIFLFEGFNKNVGEFFEEEFMASLESDFLDVFKSELSFPKGKTELFFKVDFEGVPNFEKDSVVIFNGGMGEPFLNIHIDS